MSTSTDNSLELQNLLIKKLIADETPPSGPSSLSTISIIILVTILLIIAGVVIYYIFIQNITPSYPLSPFKFGDIVVIRPAVLLEGIDPNKQYLSYQPITNTAYSYPYFPTKEGIFMGEGANAIRFIGEKDDRQSQWVLEQFSVVGHYDANQSLQYGYGNRFYLRNKSNDNVNDLKTRARYQLANQQLRGLCPSVTPAVIGSDVPNTDNWFNTELIVYFLPTNYPDIYYILFPNCSNSLAGTSPDTTRQPNNGIATIRPWSPLQGDNFTAIKPTSCSNAGPCNYPPGSYNPYNSNNKLYDNILLMNFLTADKLLPPYENANVALFKVTTLANS